jgi:hypothetical protein
VPFRGDCSHDSFSILDDEVADLESEADTARLKDCKGREFELIGFSCMVAGLNLVDREDMGSAQYRALRMGLPAINMGACPKSLFVSSFLPSYCCNHTFDTVISPAPPIMAITRQTHRLHQVENSRLLRSRLVVVTPNPRLSQTNHIRKPHHLLSTAAKHPDGQQQWPSRQLNTSKVIYQQGRRDSIRNTHHAHGQLTFNMSDEGMSSPVPRQDEKC